MFTFAILIGAYSYWIFILGILGMLYKPIVIGSSLIFLLGIYIFIYRKNIRKVVFSKKLQIWSRFFIREKLFSFLLLLLIVQAVVNFIGALGPEIGFDALWYHLTLPKLYLSQHRIYYIPGGLLYYSVMPKVAEMLYTGALSFGNEILVKLLHFCFGIITCFVIYRFSRKYFSHVISLIAVVIFYSNLVVGWESITAYIDLVRTFFEILTLWKFTDWIETNNPKFLIQSAIVLGLAITTKILAIGSLAIFLAIILIFVLRLYWSGSTTSYMRGKSKKLFIGLFVYSLFAFLIPLPWLIFSFISTGNPLYPFFTNTYIVTFSWRLLNPLVFLITIWQLFTHAADPISPIYITSLPLIIFFFSRFTKAIKIISVYSLLAIVVWYMTPNTGGGRFILPYLPAFSIVCAALIQQILLRKTHTKSRQDRNVGFTFSGVNTYIFSIVTVVLIVSIGYRSIANAKFIPVLLGRETKTAFLKSQLQFSYGDFYDTDSYFINHIKSTDTVLLFGFHNLYYVDFPFIDASWYLPGEKFDYIATQRMQRPKQYRQWQLLYQNNLTDVKLYKQ